MVIIDCCFRMRSFLSIAAPFRLPNVLSAELGSLICGPCAGALTVGGVSYSNEMLSVSLDVSFNADAETFLRKGMTRIV